MAFFIIFLPIRASVIAIMQVNIATAPTVLKRMASPQLIVR